MNISFDYRMKDWSGIGRYSESLISKMKQELVFKKNLNLIVNNIQKYKKSKFIKCNSNVFSILEQIELPIINIKNNIDLYHSPHFVFPFFNKSKIIITIHDITPLLFKEMFSLKARLYMKLMIWFSKFRADKIITVSQNTKNDLVELFNFKQNKIEVIYNGVDESYKIVKNPKNIKQVKIFYYMLEILSHIKIFQGF